MQENLFANALNPSQSIEQRDWRRQLSEDYRKPMVKMPLRQALAHRLRRVYLPLLSGLLLIWLFRLSGANESLLHAAAMSSSPGWVVLSVVIAGYCFLFVIALWPTAARSPDTGGAVDRDG